MRRKAKGPVFTALEKKSIIGLSSIMFFRMCGLFLILPVFSILAKEELVGATPMLIGFAFGAYGLSQACLQIPFGILSDRIGRKPIIIMGLILFVLGSILAATTDDMLTMVFARLLQGSGAISSSIFALIADLTRPDVRTRATAGLGASIGIAFGVSIFAASFLADWVGLKGIFWVMALMGVASMVCLVVLVPDPEPSASTVPAGSSLTMIRTVLELAPLRVIDLGAFVCNTVMSASFFLIPLLLISHGMDKTELWKVYLPMLILGGLTMVPSAIVAEVRNRFREVMMGGVALLLCSLFALLMAQQLDSINWTITALFLFFMGYNVFEPIFPSLVTRMTTNETKGTASGVYNFSSFMGSFVGASLAGMLYQEYFAALVFCIALFELSFLYAITTFPNPEPRRKSVPVSLQPAD